MKENLNKILASITIAMLAIFGIVVMSSFNIMHVIAMEDGLLSNLGGILDNTLGGLLGLLAGLLAGLAGLLGSLAGVL